MELKFGQSISGLTVDGRVLHAAVFNENEVRAAAGMTMVVGAIAFCFAYFRSDYLLLQVAATFFFIEFLARITLGLRYSPVGVVARQLTRQATTGVGVREAQALRLEARPRHVLGDDDHHEQRHPRGFLPRTLCLICLILMWMESVLGLCLGCKIHALFVRRGWATRDPAYEVCAGGECALPVRTPSV